MRAPAVKASAPEKKTVKRRGRPPKSGGKKSQLALLGGCAPGNAFAPHVLRINQGEDITLKIMLLSELYDKSICILSANGTLSSVTLRLSSQSGGLNNAVYQGHFEIISLKGSYLLSDEGCSGNCNGGLSIVVSTPCGSLFGGSVGGPLIAADPVQVIAGSFNYMVIEEKEPSTSESELSDLKVPWEMDAMPYEAPFSPLPQFGWSSLEDVELGRHGFDLTDG
ncbi:AT-hook motif nuclear-localized protein 10 [Lolium perenne]|uniref:AT-hook motif nuclear-localized protein 10 n=1 Tax=Lolium perenne TaxID=4522 RepID=UPI0021F57E13|nr:AT-hook motif nuclear-localized protein 10-like [Lolium perenne]